MSRVLDKDVWIEEQFSGADLGDKRLNNRLVAISKRMSVLPEGSIPKQLHTWAEIKACYRLFNKASITHRKIQLPHREKVKEAAKNQDTVLFLQDGSELDYTSMKATKGIGLIGNHTCQGLMIHSCLAVKYNKNNPEVIGLAYQKVWERENVSLCRTETRKERNKRKDKESNAWLTTLRAIGRPPENKAWITIGDRGADIYEFIRGSQRLGWDLVVRACQDRKAIIKGQEEFLMQWMKAVQSMGTRTITIRKKGDTTPREIDVNIAWEEVNLIAPARLNRKDETVKVWAIRCWNEEEEIDGMKKRKLIGF